MQQQQDLENEGTMQNKRKKNSTSSNKFGRFSKKLLGGCMVLGSKRLVWT
jgi:hypothetical protein